MSHVTITLPDGSTRDVSAGTPVRDVAAGISPNLAKAAFAAFVDGKLVDLSYPLQRDAAVKDPDRTRIPRRCRSCATARRT